MSYFDAHDVVAGGGGAINAPKAAPNGGDAQPGPAVAPEDLPPPQTIYVLEFKDENTGDLAAAMFERLEDIPEDFDGCTVYVYGNPTKHVFTVSKRITA